MTSNPFSIDKSDAAVLMGLDPQKPDQDLLFEWENIRHILLFRAAMANGSKSYVTKETEQLTKG